MIQAIGRAAYRARWAVIVLWVGLAVAANIWLPDLSSVVAHTNTSSLPSSNVVVQAENLEKQIDPSHASATSAVLAIHHPGRLSAADRAYFSAVLSDIQHYQARYNISSVTDLVTVPASAASALLSRDGTTELAVVGFKTDATTDATDNGIVALRSRLADPPHGAQTYVTGAAAIIYDETTISQNGVRKTEGVTIVLVLVILLLVYRAPIASLIPLLVIGLSYLITGRLVAWLGNQGLPVSSFTQTFLIAVLFGAGTDYCLLLISRFREELTRPRHPDSAAALDAMLRFSAPTVVFSGLTVLISFATLIFAGFGLYRSAVGVAIGMFVALMACLTLVPAILGVLGRGVFWPRHPKPGSGHHDSRWWAGASRLTTTHPWLSAAVVLLIVVPLALLFRDQRSFNPLDEFAPSTPSVAGFNVVSAAFSPGRVLPMNVLLHTSANLRMQSGLAAIDAVSRVLAAQPHVKEVDSATQPTGQPNSSFQLASQNAQAAHGVAALQSGMASLTQALSHTAAGVRQLQSGTQRLDQGLGRLARGADQAQRGMDRLSASAEQLATASSSIYTGTRQLAQSAAALTSSLQSLPQVAPQAHQLAAGAASLAQQTARLSGGMQQLAGASASLQRGTGHLSSGISQLQSGTRQLEASLRTLAAALQSELRGARTIDANLSSLHAYLADSAGAATNGDPGFYVPQSILAHNTDLRRSLDTYISPSGHVARLTVLLSINPYSQAAIDAVPQLRDAAQVAVRASRVPGTVAYVADTTPDQWALSNVSQADFIRTAILVLVAVYILLALLLRSVLTPFYVILSLGGTYLVTMTLLQLFFVDLMGKPGLSWTVPFFVFFLLVALGVDYSIFLMSRFNEEYVAGRSPIDAIRRAAASMGTVIFSAAIIMAGTFGSLTTAGITSLLEIGVAVIVGLLLYTLGMLALFVPACVAIVGHGHHWPWHDVIATAQEPPLQHARSA